MEAKLKADWIKALRSGEYVQATGLFENCPEAPGYSPNEPHGFCCLGVLCKVAGVPVFVDEGSNWRFVRSVLGGAEDRLVAMNDADREPFPVIADYIEQNL